MSTALDPQKLVGDAMRLGTIERVDLAGATCRVRVGEIVTGDIPWLAARAGSVSIWCPPSIGEQCLLLCPEGDEENGVALLGLYSDPNPAPASTDLFLARFADGAELTYDPAAHELRATLPGGGKVEIVAPGGLSIDAQGGVTIKGPVSIEGDVSIQGTAKASTDVIGGGKSLRDHKHTAVAAGTAVSGPPQ